MEEFIDNRITAEGTVIFMRTDVGTKSESDQPHLYLGEGKLVRLWKREDNPFENNGLKAFDGARVTVTGTLDESGVLCVSYIERK